MNEAQAQGLVDRFNVATTAVSNRIKAIIAERDAALAAGGLTAEQEQAFSDKLTTVADALDAMGKDGQAPPPGGGLPPV